MKFQPTPLQGCYLIEQEPRKDDRGFFARMYCAREFEAAGLPTDFVQINNGFSSKKGTLRGLHYQRPPHCESKLIRCVSGRIFDCVVDLRPDSPTFGSWYGEELSAENRQMMFVPKGFAHGYLALEDHSEVVYLVDTFYAPNTEGGLKWDSQALQIKWPITPSILSEKDQSLPDFDEQDWSEFAGL
ncbi:MAG TPA: dTDP-4-dehydrorhamnose 3,5-epimerase [Phycisphaerales bacterium]|nr:dTDP-4-dehydrorhamnose 3,5-epimerase [Phycisphaerales bacterium]